MLSALSLLLLSVALDVGLSSLFGSACGSGESCAPGAEPSRLGHLDRFLSTVWREQEWRAGESTLDLWLLSLARSLLSLGLAAWVVRSRRQRRELPLLLPLQAGVVCEEGREDDRVEERKIAEEKVVRKLGLGLLWLSVGWSAIKAFARLLQSGVEGPGSGVLPLEGTTPQEPWFWAMLLAGSGAVLLEYAALSLLTRSLGQADQSTMAKEGPAVDLAAGGGRLGSGRDGSKGEVDPMHGVKRAYLKDTMPEVPSVSRHFLRLMRPDAHLLAFAGVSLVVAAAGESTVPFMYGRVIDSIAINHDPTAFAHQLALLLLVALVTGIFTGFRGSTFIAIGGRCGRVGRLLTRLPQSQAPSTSGVL